MEQIIRIGMDTSKHFFQLHGVNAAEEAVLRRKLTRKEMEKFFLKLSPCEIGIEACGASHYWARWLQSLGHTVRLMPPQLVKPFVMRNKNDAADAEALCEAMSRPKVRARFVAVKTAEQQADLMLMSARERLVHDRTRLSNAIRGHAAELGYAAAKGVAHLVPLLERLQADDRLPERALKLFAMMAEDYQRLTQRLSEIDTELKAWHQSNECSQRLDRIGGVGIICAALLVMKVPDPAAFESGRDFAAYLGLTPKDHSTGGKLRLGRITRAGDEALRCNLVVGATAVIQHVRRTGKGSPWLIELLKRKPPKLVAVALANKTARIAWKLMKTGEAYNPNHAKVDQVQAEAAAIA